MISFSIVCRGTIELNRYFVRQRQNSGNSFVTAEKQDNGSGDSPGYIE